VKWWRSALKVPARKGLLGCSETLSLGPLRIERMRLRGRQLFWDGQKEGVLADREIRESRLAGESPRKREISRAV